VEFREKYSTMFGAAEVTKQREFPVGYLALPLFPGVGHDLTPVRVLAGG
jgi:hypothetical protein